MKVLLVISALLCGALAHDVMTVPKPRNPVEGSTRYCGESQNLPIAVTAEVFAGGSLQVSWKGAHISDSPNSVVQMGLLNGATSAPTQEQVNAAFNGVTYPYRVTTQAYEVPNVAPGVYTFVWKWSNYYSCADIRVKANPPPDATLLEGNKYEIPHGTFDALTGEYECNTSYELSDNEDGTKSCTMTGGAIFGVFLLVLILVALVGGIGVMIFLYVKKRETFDKIVAKVKGIRGN